MDQTGSDLVREIETTWVEIQARHPDVPAVVATLASSGEGRRLRRVLGHFASERWHVADGQVAELFVAGELLASGGQRIMVVLLHEATHGVAHTRQVSDTSGRANRYHNHRFARIAGELGLEMTRDSWRGYVDDRLSPEATEQWADAIARLEAAAASHRKIIRAPRQPSPSGALLARCKCGRRIRVAPTVLAVAPIRCGRCKTAFKEVVQSAI